jgi:hypothetical protein
VPTATAGTYLARELIIYDPGVADFTADLEYPRDARMLQVAGMGRQASEASVLGSYRGLIGTLPTAAIPVPLERREVGLEKRTSWN